jgi:hypothetical protein
MSANIDWLDAAISKYLTGRLARFRAELEEGTEQSIGTLQINAALLLSDLCRFLGLDEQQHDYVLGEGGVQHVLEVLETRVLICTAPLPTLQGTTPERLESVLASVPTDGLR